MTAVGERPARISRSDKTRRRLLLTAERLFGEQGIESVSLRQIAAEARQGNHHAVQYHFGSKAVLVEELLEWRRQPMNARRREMLDTIASSAMSRDELVRATVEAIVLPMAQYLGIPHSHFLRFNYQWVMDSGLITRAGETTPYRVVDNIPSGQTGAEAVNLLIDALSDLGSRTAELRIVLVFTLLLGALAQRERVEQSGTPISLPREVFLSELLDSLVAILLR
jgi:AcrR family transcriptional regulator